MMMKREAAEAANLDAPTIGQRLGHVVEDFLHSGFDAGI
jgi:hypothetical protein